MRNTLIALADLDADVAVQQNTAPPAVTRG
jgi:hypothetical protein